MSHSSLRLSSAVRLFRQVLAASWLALHRRIFNIARCCASERHANLGTHTHGRKPTSHLMRRFRSGIQCFIEAHTGGCSHGEAAVGHVRGHGCLYSLVGSATCMSARKASWGTRFPALRPLLLAAWCCLQPAAADGFLLLAARCCRGVLLLAAPLLLAACCCWRPAAACGLKLLSARCCRQPVAARGPLLLATCCCLQLAAAGGLLLLVD